MPINFTYKFQFSIIIYLLSLVSCNNQQKVDLVKETAISKVDSSMYIRSGSDVFKIDTSSIPESESKEVVERVENKSVFPLGKYKTLPSIMRNVFSVFSTKEEVYNVQGRPNQVQNIDYPEEKEVWVYGECEVTFKDGFVEQVVNENKKIKYADFYELSVSPDFIEDEFAKFLLNRKISKDIQNRH